MKIAKPGFLVSQLTLGRSDKCHGYSTQVKESWKRAELTKGTKDPPSAKQGGLFWGVPGEGEGDRKPFCTEVREQAASTGQQTGEWDQCFEEVR